MATIQDIPLSVFPITVVAKLACINRAMCMVARTEMQQRDTELEIFAWLRALHDADVFPTIYRFTMSHLWRLCERVCKTYGNQNSNVFFVAPSYPVRVNVKINGFNTNTNVSVYARVGLDISFICTKPHMTMEGLYQEAYDDIDAFVRTKMMYFFAGEIELDKYARIDWLSESMFYHGINFTEKQTYISEAFHMDSFKEEMPEVVIIETVEHVRYIALALVYMP